MTYTLLTTMVPLLLTISFGGCFFFIDNNNKENDQ